LDIECHQGGPLIIILAARCIRVAGWGNRSKMGGHARSTVRHAQGTVGFGLAQEGETTGLRGY
jgi:hypothetical protein